ncbi:hypothetical protein G3O08_14790 [Cryomorpha ignava]|uniref:DUF5615 domain-containing protein n=1 Tax=Cryomorpha ignava TaxID=101383 RepID=A0A7K3WSU8_9FLAO|nr:DUF5615 family PIN-like protein [Cryomorpha ignava]NEN24770.1 hypothetical protein [Cryomorpha ignava]
MKFLANENFPIASFKILNNIGWDIEHIGNTNNGITDNKVMAIAMNESRIIVTFDSDYGELVFKYGYKPPGGIYLRIQDFKPEYPGKLLIDIIDVDKLDVENKFTVIDDNQIKQRKI